MRGREWEIGKERLVLRFTIGSTIGRARILLLPFSQILEQLVSVPVRRVPIFGQSLEIHIVAILAMESNQAGIKELWRAVLDSIEGLGTTVSETMKLILTRPPVCS